MAHGIGGIKSAGLAPFGEHFAANGLVAIAFDYRHWGASEGVPRELLSLRRQRADYRAVLAWVATDPALSPLPRFIWGTSFAGMHVVALAATEPGLSGAVAQCPLVDGLAGSLRIPWTHSLRLTGRAVADRLGALLGRDPIYLPVSVGPGELGVIATDDSLTGLDRLAPSNGNWPNRITARSLLSIFVSRPVRHAAKIRCAILMVVAEDDTMAPTAPAIRVAAKAQRGEVYRSRGGHYDVYAGGLDHDSVLRVETEFLLRCAAEAPKDK
jgi:alpha-beta hydrolase superfamily lysophospholipase